MPRINWKQKCEKLRAEIEHLSDEYAKAFDAQDEEKAQLEGKIESMREDFECLTAERDKLDDDLNSLSEKARGYLAAYNAERERIRALEQKLTYVRTQAEAYLAYILVLKQSLGDQGKR